MDISKTTLAKQLGIARSSLYYQPKRPALDQEIKLQIESVWVNHPAYGHKRLAPELKLGKNRVLRVMHKFNLKPYRRRARGPSKPDDQGKPNSPYPNLIKGLCPLVPNVVWVADFTYIRFQERFIYLATIMELFTREIIGWNLSRFHNAELVLGALNDAVKRTSHIPQFFHSDQGSEYDSGRHTNLCQTLHIQISMSAKSSPWENAYQESFYSHFKVDLGDPERFNVLGELIEAIHLQLHYYNTTRRHSSLGNLSPQTFQKEHNKKHPQGRSTN